MTYLGKGELTSNICWVVNIGTVDGFEVWQTLGSSLVELLALGFTFVAWGISTLEEGCELGMVLQRAVSLGSLVGLEVGDSGGAGGFEAGSRPL